jgi:hypothetical protein
MTIKQSAYSAVFDYLDKLPIGTQFSGLTLQKIMNRKSGATHFADTYLRYLRYYRREKRNVVNVNRAKSLYQIVGK